MEENYLFERVQIKACNDVVWTLTPSDFAQQASTEAILMYGLSFIICILFQLSSGEIVFLVVEWNNVDSQSGYIQV